MSLDRWLELTCIMYYPIAGLLNGTGECQEAVSCFHDRPFNVIHGETFLLRLFACRSLIQGWNV